MTKLDSNFGAPFHVATYDKKQLGVVNSYADRAEAEAAGSALKQKLEASGTPDTDVYVVEGQDGLAALLEELEGVPTAVQTDNSVEHDQELADAMTPADDAPAPKSKGKK